MSCMHRGWGRPDCKVRHLTDGEAATAPCWTLRPPNGRGREAQTANFTMHDACDVLQLTHLSTGAKMHVLALTHEFPQIFDTCLL